MKQWRKWMAGVIGIAVSAMLVSVSPLFANKVYAGLVVEGLDGVALGGQSKEEAGRILQQWRQEHRSKRIAAVYGDQTFYLTADAIDFDIDVTATLNEVWNYGRQGSWWERLGKIRAAGQTGYCVPLMVHYNENKLNRCLQEWRVVVDQPPRSAALRIRTGSLVQPLAGRRLVMEELEPVVVNAFKHAEVSRLLLPVTVVPPAVTAGDIAKTGVKVKLAEFVSRFNSADVNRTTNIQLAAAKIHDTIIYPGQIFSFNAVVGPRDKAYGFQTAPELVDGELVPGIGGGICQVSSTLYNVVLLAGLPVVERYNHSKPLDYVPLGRDATVVFGSLDFRFANTTGAPLMLMAEVEDGKLTVAVFGSRRSTESVDIITADKQVIAPPITKEPDNQLYLGETRMDNPGKPGYEVSTVRIVRKNGVEIKREIVSRDQYLPEAAIVKVGTRMPPFASGY